MHCGNVKRASTALLGGGEELFLKFSVGQAGVGDLYGLARLWGVGAGKAG